MILQKFQQIFRSSFADGEVWRQWFFDTVANDENAVELWHDGQGKAVAALLRQEYAMKFLGTPLPAEYVSCVATLPEARGKGAASALMLQALRHAADDGKVFCMLIPAQDHLYYFYRRFGFSTVFYCDRLNYSAAHTFGDNGGSVGVPDYELFHRLESQLSSAVMHTEADYCNILADMRIDGGDHCISVVDGDKCAALFAIADDAQVTVKSLLADDESVAETALCELRRREPGKHITVLTPPASGNRAFLRPHGMGRIVNAMPVLEALAAAGKKLKTTIRLTDPLLPHNNGYYALSNGTCTFSPVPTYRRADLEVSVDVLARILMSSPSTGEIFGLPSARPYMALMLD